MSTELAPKTTQPLTQTTPKPASLSSQSRDNAVADLVTAVVQQAGQLKLTKDESDKLLADFEDSDFQPGAGGKENLIYIEHAALRKRLNDVLGMGQWALIVRDTWQERNGNATTVYSRAMLIVRGCYVGEAVGDMNYYPNNASQNYGDAFEGSKSAAFRRCAKEFGIGLQAWRKDWCLGWWSRKNAKKTGTTASRNAYSAPKAQLEPSLVDGASEGIASDEADYLASKDDLSPPDGEMPDFGAPNAADEQSEPLSEALEWTGDVKMVKPPVGKGPAKIYAMDNKTIFSLWPKDKAVYTAFQKQWGPPSNHKKFRIEYLKEVKGEFTNLTVQLIEAV